MVVKCEIVNNKITPCINLPTVHITIEQHVLLSNLKMLLAVRNRDASYITLSLSSYDIE